MTTASCQCLVKRLGSITVHVKYTVYLHKGVKLRSLVRLKLGLKVRNFIV